MEWVGPTHGIDHVPIFCHRSEVCCTRAQNGCQESNPHGAPSANQRKPLPVVSGRTVGALILNLLVVGDQEDLGDDLGGLRVVVGEGQEDAARR